VIRAALFSAAPLTLFSVRKEIGTPAASSLLTPQREFPSFPAGKQKDQLSRIDAEEYKAIMLQNKTLQIIYNHLETQVLVCSLEPLETMQSETIANYTYTFHCMVPVLDFQSQHPFHAFFF
jgi:hypothetical protein